MKFQSILLFTFLHVNFWPEDVYSASQLNIPRVDELAVGPTVKMFNLHSVVLYCKGSTSIYGHSMFNLELHGIYCSESRGIELNSVPVAGGYCYPRWVWSCLAVASLCRNHGLSFAIAIRTPANPVRPD